MVTFQVSLNFDPVRVILKIRCLIYILMKKVIILRKIHVAIKSFAPPFSNHFSLSLNGKKRESHEKNVFTLQLPIHYILYQNKNIDWCKCGHCKNEAREIDCPCCREVNAVLIASAKILKREGSILLSSFYGQLSDYQSHVLALSTQQMSSSFCS